MIRKILLVSIFFIIGVCVFAQDGTYGAYSPYSIMELERYQSRELLTIEVWEE